MSENFLIIIVVFAVSLGVFGLIKLICRPIKTITAILLIIPTVATCGVALLIFKFFKNNYELSSYFGNTSYNNNNYSTTSYNNIPSFDKPKQTENKKPKRSFTDAFGKTTYYDDEGKYMGTSMDNGFGKTTFTDAENNYIGEGFDDGMGRTTYTDKDGNITFSNTNYCGDETFSDGTISKKDSSGNTYY